MKYLTEADIRAMRLADGAALLLPAGRALGPLAQEYCAQRGIRVEEPSHGKMTMGAPQAGFVDAETGQHMDEKPEHMTHLNGNVLVPKTHPRIRLRGKLDSLQAQLLLAARQAIDAQRPETAAALEEFHAFAQTVLGCEVTELPLPPYTLLGLNSAGLRHASHHPQEFAGIPHPVPHSGMPSLCLTLNFLRTQVRKAELCAVEAELPDLIEALNRFSSAVYLLFLKELSS